MARLLPPDFNPLPGPDTMTTPHDLKNAGLKATLPRLKIINLFETSKVRHLTAEDVYRHLGWSRAGEIPDFATTPDGEHFPTVYYFKQLGA